MVIVVIHCMVRDPRVEDMMKRSFAELDSARHQVDRQQAVQELEQNVGSLQRLDCPICDTDIDHYYGACARITYLKKKMQVRIQYYILSRIV